MTDLSKLTRKIGYQFRDPDLLTQALTHRSFSGKHNERLEFLGDSIVNLVIAEILCERFPNLDEGELSRFRALLVKGETLAEVAQSLTLGEYLNLGGGELKSGGYRRPSILADALEALIGAIYRDSDLKQCQTLIRAWFADRIDCIEQTAEKKDPKTALQEYLQSKKLPLPQYELISSIGVEHQQMFLVECRVSGKAIITQGQSNTRRKAEQIAAQKFLTHLFHEK